MSGAKEKLEMAELLQRGEADLKALRDGKAEELHKVRFKHALGQLKETHTVRTLRRAIAKINTAMTQKVQQVGDKA